MEEACDDGGAVYALCAGGVGHHRDRFGRVVGQCDRVESVSWLDQLGESVTDHRPLLSRIFPQLPLYAGGRL